MKNRQETARRTGATPRAGQPRRPSRRRLARAALAGGLAVCGLAQAQDAAAPVDPWKVDVYYENDTRFRGKDATGERVGLSKFRNTLQVEADKKLEGGWKFRSILRGSFDGVYRMNDDQYGRKAGGGVLLESQGGPPPVPHGSGIVNKGLVDGLGLVNNVFGFNATNPGAPNYNPNEGLRLLGDRWHDSLNGGVEFATPVRPCDTDRRGCADFGGYGDKKRSELELPEFNERWDVIREAFVTNTVGLADGKQLFLKLGKQQVVWGRTDLFRVLDVINPVDYSRNNIYDELQDIRIPMWIAQAEYRMGPSESMQDRNLQLVWNFDKFRPNNLGQCGTANVILDAGCFFRGMKNLWDNGGTVANFANVGPGVLLSTDFGPGQIGLRDVKLPNWSLKNTQLGLKYEGVSQDGLSFSLNALTYRSQLPSLHGGKGATNSFTGETRTDAQGGWPYLIAFDMHFPRVNLIGGSMDFEWQAAKAAVRVEAAFTNGEEFANTLKPQLYSKNKVFRSVVGFDRPTFVPFINPNRTTLFSAQLFYQHIFDHEFERGQFGPVGMPDWENNVIATLLMKAFLVNDRVSPQLITAYDVQARALVTSPQVDWIVTDKFKISFGGNFKLRNGEDRWKFDDCRSCNPFPPFTAPFGDTDPLSAYSRGLGGLEPLGRFRAGPIGSAWKENEIFLTARYQF
ncbi:DUF1302 domain-containing protein [Methylibium sp. Pch-M]|uniref:DUF1302 family protein n=1 Tax=Methylibium sp. Pch-M TaxID=2082386 RepID=UPI0010108788|nr:DUF1302 family protein [Methylibium sp. Pch-M]QAZ39067.1 DUF1302 domain-containing protein [Methylibium sp. Pch-M]QAZ40699.1 DUF1302 domain-containing protein [Methylibium sp. Pch-M]QAZ40859.1 DUF1302 domain-containing protein [Methylibium sp. Pch-M]